MNNHVPPAKAGLSGRTTLPRARVSHPRPLFGIVLGAALLIFPFTHLLAADPPKPPAFLTVGGRYGFCLMVGVERPIWVVKVLELAPDGWVHVQRIAPHPLGAIHGDHSASKSGSFAEPWINVAQLGAVILDDAPEATHPADAKPSDSFPKLGARYHFGAGPSSLPSFGEVLENGDDGWFRVQELQSSSGSKSAPQKPRQWWVRSAAVAWLDEAKPAPAAH